MSDICEYEKQRNENIARNQKVWIEQFGPAVSAFEKHLFSHHPDRPAQAQPKRQPYVSRRSPVKTRSSRKMEAREFGLGDEDHLSGSDSEAGDQGSWREVFKEVNPNIPEEFWPHIQAMFDEHGYTPADFRRKPPSAEKIVALGGQDFKMKLGYAERLADYFAPGTASEDMAYKTPPGVWHPSTFLGIML